MVEFVAKRPQGLVKLLAEQGVPFSEAQRALRKRDVKVNGARVGRDVEVQAGDKVVAYVREEKKPPAVIYEDENVLARG